MCDALITKIKQAFANVNYPGDENLTHSTYGDEPAALVTEFCGKTDWQKLDAKFLDQAPDGWGSALSFFSNDALRFYLPAYMIADIRGQLMCSDPSIRLCLSLTPMVEKKKIAKIWGGGTMGERAREEFDRYDAQQVSAIVEYLWWKLESGDDYDLVIEQAMENYWLNREMGSY
ncbi:MULTISPECIES: DUF6714 family protein [unclassified Leptolyngbya]|uniref:DUF6714 family protein n=1 Tax=unclassified Leptolyngbya TaxID=2650499 RepID=UPI0016873273|nr:MULTISPECIES: DUF6714 family protein [unclassified Leptolyngbya]MBD1913348.1 hypothetical protein [Leptolyngbya sp. FACHB-8]MBD2154503.1 hypothetical protein [Leptolyngbya sp. FACHB-16]